MSHRKNACGKRPGRGLTAATFFAPFLLALTLWLAAPGEGLAQNTNPTDPLSLLQQTQRNGLGAFGGLNNGVVDTTTQGAQTQILQPQACQLLHGISVTPKFRRLQTEQLSTIAPACMR